MGVTGFDFDAIVIGSGFGGSVMTCRLAEKGYRVCLLERGREYGFNEFSRRMDEIRGAYWDPRDRLYGLFEFLAHDDSDVFTLTASGLGGGSLIYSSVLQPMPADFFYNWPGGIKLNTLKPYYDRVLKTMEASPYPFGDKYYQDTPKTRMLKDAAGCIPTDSEAIHPPKGFFPHLAIWFEGSFPAEQSLNSHGRVQSRCNKCGGCTIGCNIHAKNTLDLNYIARARNKKLLGEKGRPAEVRTHAQAVDIIPLDSEGYLVKYKDPREGRMAPLKELRAKKVVVSCGSVGTSGLLLRLKRDGSLPGLSDSLGKGWSGNGDLEATVLDTREQAIPTKGPVITYAIEYYYPPYPGGFPHGIFIEDGGFPYIVTWYIAGKMPSPSSTMNLIKLVWKFLTRMFRKYPEINIGDDIAGLIDNDDYLRRMILLLGMGRDRSDGTVEINDRNDVIVKWRMEGSSLHLERQKREMERLAKAMGGTLLLNPITYNNKLVAVHPIGGCVMADSPDRGAVNPDGEAFGHPGLYVADGSIIPTSTGPNPSLTIAALAERIADKITTP